ncbi:hypothetical protein B9Z55_027083 [Caenorhabditis nigoni]|uniref:Uncharacterized protein n=1 Tax=Caenorhabditis nigoni TaxID=1611254 RepID=A0A2G5SIN9_9PELO|nr:hypothetical protein B9Z55_027083 [Caenorhabditis nigoni]
MRINYVLGLTTRVQMSQERPTEMPKLKNGPCLSFGVRRDFSSRTRRFLEDAMLCSDPTRGLGRNFCIL